MSENKGKKAMVKVTIESSQGNVRTIECDGIAFTAITERENGHEANCGIVGSMSITDLFVLENATQGDLCSNIRKNIYECLDEVERDPSAVEIIKKLLGVN